MSKYKILVTARSFGKCSPEAADLLESNGCELIRLTPDCDKLQLAAELDGVIAGLDTYDTGFFQAAAKLKVVSRYGVGYDKVDIESASAQNVVVTITPGANGDSVADLAMTLMLECARKTCYMNAQMKAGLTTRPTGLEMWKKTVGIVGAGRIGKGVAKRCRGFEMKVLYCGHSRHEDFEKELGAEYVSFEELIAQSDFISIHSPLTSETANMFDRRTFEQMKNTAVLVNTARGGIIDEDALYDALNTGEIFGAGLDVLSNEGSATRLGSLDNCVLTPHAGAATVEAGNRMSLMSAQNLLDVLLRGECKYRVN